MASERQNMSEQEISIKAREHELYVKTLPDSQPVKPFPVYLRETPAEPFSPATKAVLWMLGIVVSLLFLGAVWRVSMHRVPTSRTRPAAKTATLNSPIGSPIATSLASHIGRSSLPRSPR
jgi:hypothetical protein